MNALRIAFIICAPSLAFVLLLCVRASFSRRPGAACSPAVPTQHVVGRSPLPRIAPPRLITFEERSDGQKRP